MLLGKALECARSGYCISRFPYNFYVEYDSKTEKFYRISKKQKKEFNSTFIDELSTWTILTPLNETVCYGYY